MFDATMYFQVNIFFEYRSCSRNPITVAGAGPVGLIAALLLAERADQMFRIRESSAATNRSSRPEMSQADFADYISDHEVSYVHHYG
jgi:hypothetical protein